MIPNEPATNTHLVRLLDYLETDPTNKTLASEAAQVALSSGQATIALEILDTIAARVEIDGPLSNLAGLAALQTQDFNRATEIFRDLLSHRPESHELRYNLAFSVSRQNEIDKALDLLDETTTRVLPQAALLKVQLLHFMGNFEEAMLTVKAELRHHEDDIALLGIASVLAMDLEDTEFAKFCAEKSIYLHESGEIEGFANPDALTTIGYLSLDDGNINSATTFFDDAIKAQPFAPRAWIGRGLARIAAGDYAIAADEITRGSEMFGDHLGSWIAAGWAHVLNNDLITARVVFERTLTLDGTFSESHGSLGVVEMMEGNLGRAKELASRALRLDRQSFSGALVTSMILSSGGNPDAANKIVERALTSPIDAQGRTLMDAMLRLGTQKQLP